jgi:sigma-B regulation protein RsbU (phosphoserine phosphatase)
MLQAGESLFLFTDGVIEARTDNGDFYSEKRLMRLLGESSGSLHAQVAAIKQNVIDFSGGKSLADDVTILALKRL